MLHFSAFVLYFSNLLFRIDEAVENNNLLVMGSASIEKKNVALQNITILSNF